MKSGYCEEVEERLKRDKVVKIARLSSCKNFVRERSCRAFCKCGILMNRRRGRVVCHLFVITSDTETARGQIRPGENGREYFLQTCQIRGLYQVV